MQTRVINEENPKFQPITIQLTIENVEELKDLWHRMNIPMDTAIASSSSSGSIVGRPKYTIAEESSYKIWRLLDDLAIKHKIKKS